MDEIKFTINLPARSKKNSQQILVNPRTRRPFISPSPAYKAYRAAALTLIPADARKGIDEPVNVKAVFYMPTARKVDLTNLLECCDDVLRDAGVIADDHSGIVAGHDGSRVLLDREHPRTEVTITRIEP